MQRIDNFVRGTANAVTFGLADRIAGTGDSVVFGGSLSDNIDRQVQQSREASRTDSAYTAGTVGGFLLGASGLLKAGGTVIGRMFNVGGINAEAAATAGNISTYLTAAKGALKTGLADAAHGFSAAISNAGTALNRATDSMRLAWTARSLGRSAQIVERFSPGAEVGVATAARATRLAASTARAEAGSAVIEAGAGTRTLVTAPVIGTGRSFGHGISALKSGMVGTGNIAGEVWKSPVVQASAAGALAHQTGATTVATDAAKTIATAAIAKARAATTARGL